MLTALLVDDDPLANERMRELLAAHPEIDVGGGGGGRRRHLLDRVAP
jgi:DNA-binding LytR/AlgR family response regulator